MKTGNLLFVVNLACAWFMTGIMWFVQIVHYPLYQSVGAAHFPEYEQAHVRLTTLVVGLPFLVEMATALLLLHWRPNWLSFRTAMIGSMLLVLIWLSSALLQVPIHLKLEQTQNRVLIEDLVRTNWLRTILWSARAVLLVHVGARLRHPSPGKL